MSDDQGPGPIGAGAPPPAQHPPAAAPAGHGAPPPGVGQAPPAAPGQYGPPPHFAPQAPPAAGYPAPPPGMPHAAAPQFAPQAAAGNPAAYPYGPPTPAAAPAGPGGPPHFAPQAPHPAAVGPVAPPPYGPQAPSPQPVQAPVPGAPGIGAPPPGAPQAPPPPAPQAPGAAGAAAPPPAGPAFATTGKPNVDAAVAVIAPIVQARIDPATARRMPRRDVASSVKDIVAEVSQRGRVSLNRLESRDVATVLIEGLLGSAQAGGAPRPGAPPGAAPEQPAAPAAAGGRPPPPSLDPGELPGAHPCTPSHSKSTVEQAKLTIQPILIERMDISAATSLPRAELARQISEIVAEISVEQKIRLNSAEQRDLVTTLINDMLGLGPLEALLADETITDIMVNGKDQVYIERRGKLELSSVRFRDDAQLMNICSRIVTAVGRRVDDSSPLVDARLADGSRVNIVIPPLAIDGAAVSIRKFSKKSITLDIMAKQGNISHNMATVLKVAARSRLNILISGGTGSGKTTILNAMSQLIDHGERIVTIEDAAELQLLQPHVVRLETRPPNLEGQGEISMRDLVKNALRMRPDRIIMGEVRGSEAVDMLQAMNTGHEGSMCTIHANRPREALTRLENMVGLAGINLSAKAVRTQIAAAVDLVVQVSRMRDGMRRVVSIIEIVGMEDDVVVTQELFSFQFQGEDSAGRLSGTFASSGLRPHFAAKAEYFNLDRTLLEAI